MNAIEARGLVRDFKRVRAVDGACLTVPAGAIYGLAGDNGAGKSTLLKLICGLIGRGDGTVRVLDRELASCESDPRVGALIEEPAVYPKLDPFENLMNRALVMGLPDPKGACRAALLAVGLDDPRVAGDGSRRVLWPCGSSVEDLSTGMRQRLGVALALLGDPQVLVLDEPFSGIDPATSRSIRELVARLSRERGVSVVVSSHSLAHLERICTHFGIMRHGRIVRELTADELRRAHAACLVMEASAPERAVAVIAEELPGLLVQMLEDGRLRVTTPGGGVPDRRVLSETLLAAGIAVTGLEVVEPDLEGELVSLMHQDQKGR